MATSVVTYASALNAMFRGDLDLNEGVIGIVLLTTKTGIVHEDMTVAEVLARDTEVSDSSYERYYLLLDTDPSQGHNLMQDGNTLTFNLDDVTFESLTSSDDIEAALIFRADSSGGDDDLDRALCYVDLDGPITVSGDNLTIRWNASGVFTVTTS